MLDCLDSKAPAVAECEGKMHTLWKQRADDRAARAERDTADLAEVAAAAVDEQRQPQYGGFQDPAASSRDAASARVAARRARLAAAAAAASSASEAADGADWLPSDDDEEGGGDGDGPARALRNRRLQDEVVDNSRRIFADVRSFMSLVLVCLVHDQ